eukprot:scaffold30756_cov57-Phaeocystis_antarctica.AAC.1
MPDDPDFCQHAVGAYGDVVEKCFDQPYIDACVLNCRPWEACGPPSPGGPPEAPSPPSPPPSPPGPPSPPSPPSPPPSLPSPPPSSPPECHDLMSVADNTAPWRSSTGYLCRTLLSFNWCSGAPENEYSPHGTAWFKDHAVDGLGPGKACCACGGGEPPPTPPPP